MEEDLEHSVIAVMFPAGLERAEFDAIILTLKTAFVDRDDVKVMLAIGDAAETIIFFAENGELPVEEAEESNLVKHAREELSRIDNDGEFNESIISAVRAFSKYGHSGGSASVAIPMLHDLLQFKNLTPLTDDPKEWMQHDDNTWQSTRNPAAFSEDGGETHYILNGDGSRGNLVITEKKE